MDEFCGFFSAHALHQLNNFCDTSRLIIEQNVPPSAKVEPKEEENTYSATRYPAQARPKRKATDFACHIPGTSVLSLSNAAGRNRKRSKFDAKSRRKVAIVRKRGACIRCRILKIPVRPCMEQAVASMKQI